MSKVSENMINAFNIMSKAAVNNAGYDKTIEAQIISYENDGKYRCNYQGAIIQAYSGNQEVIYDKDDYVYILVPRNDMTKRKIIIFGIRYGSHKDTANFTNIEVEKILASNIIYNDPAMATSDGQHTISLSWDGTNPLIKIDTNVYTLLRGDIKTDLSKTTNDLPNRTIGSVGTLPVAKGGTGKTNLTEVTVGKANQLANARNLRVNLEETAAAAFDGTENVTNIGVTGVLPVNRGGTGTCVCTMPENGAVYMTAFQDNQTAMFDIYERSARSGFIHVVITSKGIYVNTLYTAESELYCTYLHVYYREIGTDVFTEIPQNTTLRNGFIGARFSFPNNKNYVMRLIYKGAAAQQLVIKNLKTTPSIRVTAFNANEQQVSTQVI